MSNKMVFGFALADSMFSGDVCIKRQVLSLDEVHQYLANPNLIVCLNPSHVATIQAMRSRFGIDVVIPERPPQVQLGVGDDLIVMGVRGLPRLTDRHEYDNQEIESATFNFTMYTVL